MMLLFFSGKLSLIVGLSCDESQRISAARRSRILKPGGPESSQVRVRQVAGETQNCYKGIARGSRAERDVGLDTGCLQNEPPL